MREGIKPPKFADKFFRLDWDADPMPVISLFPFPEPPDLSSFQLDVCGLDCRRKSIGWSDCAAIPRVRLRSAIICSIFNWVEVVEWEGVRLSDFLDHVGLDTHPEGYFAFYSSDGLYFEGLPRELARDPGVLLATGLNGQLLSPGHGGPVRLVVPFLQGYKSVKWLSSIRAFRHDPVGIKRLLAQSKTGYLGMKWREEYRIPGADGRGKPPV